MANILLKDKNGSDVIYRDVASVRLRTEEGGFASFGEPQGPNIAYGDIAPEDTSKLWVKTSEPNKVHIGYELPSQEVATFAMGARSTGVDITKLSAKLTAPWEQAGVASVGTKIFIIGGYNGNRGTYSNKIYCYDTVLDEITTLGVTMPKTVCDVGTVVIGTDVYILYTNEVYRFDTVNNNVVTCGNSDTASSKGFRGVAVGSYIYEFGSYSGGMHHQHIRRYDVTTETGKRLSAKIPQGLAYPGLAAIGTTIYVFGGKTNTSKTDAIYKFDTTTNSIEELAEKLPNIESHLAAFVSGKFIYLIGFNFKIYEFDTETEKVRTFFDTSDIALQNYGVAKVGHKFYTFGGNDGVSNVPKSDIYGFSVGVPLESGTLAIIQSPNSNVFPIISSESVCFYIGIDTIYKGNSDGVGEKVTAALYINDEWTTI